MPVPTYTPLGNMECMKDEASNYSANTGISTYGSSVTKLSSKESSASTRSVTTSVYSKVLSANIDQSSVRERIENSIRHALKLYEVNEVEGAMGYKSKARVVNQVSRKNEWKHFTSTFPDNELTVKVKDRSCKASGIVKGNYRHFVEASLAETTKELYEMYKFQETVAEDHQVVDAAVLCTLPTDKLKLKATNVTHLFFGIKYASFQAIATPGGNNRKGQWDTCIIEHLCYTVDSNNREIGILTQLPIVRPECPESSKFTRLKEETVVIIRNPEEEELESLVNEEVQEYAFVFGLKTVQTSGEVSYNFNCFVSQLNTFERVAELRRLSTVECVSRQQWVPNDMRKFCGICTKPFGMIMMRGRHHCRLCGELICRKCCVTHRVRMDSKEEDEASNAFQLEKKKFCVVCISKLSATGSYRRLHYSSTIQCDEDEDDEIFDEENDRRSDCSTKTTASAFPSYHNRPSASKPMVGGVVLPTSKLPKAVRFQEKNRPRRYSNDSMGSRPASVPSSDNEPQHDVLDTRKPDKVHRTLKKSISVLPTSNLLQGPLTSSQRFRSQADRDYFFAANRLAMKKNITPNHQINSIYDTFDPNSDWSKWVCAANKRKQQRRESRAKKLASKQNSAQDIENIPIAMVADADYIAGGDIIAEADIIDIVDDPQMKRSSDGDMLASAQDIALNPFFKAHRLSFDVQLAEHDEKLRRLMFAKASS